ncbi:MAG: glycosyltransferase, partial [Halobacteriaceae archaeon]
ILCPSEITEDIASDKGYDTIYLPLGVSGKYFKPLGKQRSGIGFAGNTGNKPEEQMQAVYEPIRDNWDIEVVTDKRTPQELNEWYNQKLVTIGMTVKEQEKVGMVNNRVFEALASGTPLIMNEHRSLDSVLGMDYPYQSGNLDKTKSIVREILSDKDRVASEFHDYSTYIRKKHNYKKRFRKLFCSIYN